VAGGASALDVIPISISLLSPVTFDFWSGIPVSWISILRNVALEEMTTSNKKAH